MNWLRLGFVPAALALAVPLMASELQPISADVTGARLAQLLEIDSIRVTKRAFNLGLLTQDLGYTLAVAADGTVTNCQLSRSFRNPITTREMCRSITRAVTLAPARDAAGNPVSGTYQGMIRIQSPFAATQ